MAVATQPSRPSVTNTRVGRGVCELIAFGEYRARGVLRLEDERIVTGQRFLAQATI